MLPRVATARAAVKSKLDRTAPGRRVHDFLHNAEQVAAEAAELPARLVRAVAEVEALLGRVGPLLDRMEDLTERAAGVLAAAGETVNQAAALNAQAAAAVYDASGVSAEARALVARAAGVTDSAAQTMAVAERATQGAEALLSHVEPIVARGAPLAEKFVNGLSAAEIDAAIKLVDELPRLTDHLRQDILPILATLERAGPDISELVRVSYDVRRAILGIPGFGFFRRRGEDALADVEDETLDEDDPPEAAPLPAAPPVPADVPPGSSKVASVFDPPAEPPAKPGKKAKRPKEPKA